MYSLDYLDETFIDACKKQVKRVYHEFNSSIVGASQDKTCAIAQVFFPDGVFYFRVTDDFISHAFNSKEEADRG